MNGKTNSLSACQIQIAFDLESISKSFSQMDFIKSPAMVCLDCVSESAVEEVAALPRRYAQAAAASRSVLGANATGLSLQRDKKVVYRLVLRIKNVS
jgi:hypothetical protein